MFQFVLDQALLQGRRGRIFRKLLFWILLVHDPVVRYTLNGKRLALHLSHMLPWARINHPTYSANLSRLASFVRGHSGNLRMIDVGANIGDSYALAGSEPGDRFLLVEGSASYMELLAVNTKDDPAVSRVQALLTDHAHAGTGILILEGGNARLEGNDPDAPLVEFHTLDDLVTRHPEFNSANLLKTDVDSYDARVLRGAENLIRASTPVLFFEHHPYLLALAKEDDRYIFPLLKSWGYSKLIFYDVEGFLIGIVNADDSKLLDELVFYAKSKGVLCYDVCCFHDKLSDARDRFLASEKSYYEGLIAKNLAEHKTGRII